MTAELFNRRHGPAWDAFKKSPMFGDLLRLADGQESPSATIHKIPLEKMAENHIALVGTIAGFGLFRSLLLKLGSNPTTPEDEPDFAMTVEEQFAQDNPPERKPKKKK